MTLLEVTGMKWSEKGCCNRSSNGYLVQKNLSSLELGTGGLHPRCRLWNQIKFMTRFK